jgi:alpha-beta hydrolase superfamily lysophospholipase
MNHIEGDFKGPRNIPIHHQAWLPDGAPNAALLFVHGMGSHSGRYMNIVDQFVPRGVAVFGHDHIGHGKSGGERGMVRRFEDFTDALAVHSGMVRARLEGRPVFLFGHSMGGLIAAAYLLEGQAEFRGAILSAPALFPARMFPPGMVLLGRVLAAVMPRRGLIRLSPARLSHDPDVVRAYLNDPLVFHGKTPAHLAAELLRAMRRVSQEVEKIALPFLTFAGGADKIVNPDCARMLHERAGSKDKTIIIYEGLYHETFNEPERARVLGDMAAWLEARIG